MHVGSKLILCTKRKLKKKKNVLLLSAFYGQSAADSQDNPLTAIIFPAKPSVSERMIAYNVNSTKTGCDKVTFAEFLLEELFVQR